MIHIVEGFGIVNKAEICVFLELSCFFDDPTDVGILILDKTPSNRSCFFDDPTDVGILILDKTPSNRKNKYKVDPIKQKK